MEDNKKNIEETEGEVEVITLTDEDGNETDFEFIAEYEKDGNHYYALIPAEEEPSESDVCEYIILKLAVEDGEEVLVTIDDDDEQDDVADYFDDLFSQEIDYDN